MDHQNKTSTYPRTINLTNIRFTAEEQALLDLGLQYNMQKPTASTWTNLALETERAIRLLDIKFQQSYRTIAAKKLRQILNTNHHNTTHKRQLHVLKQIKLKITEGNALIARADKGKTTVVIYTHDYTQKVHSFISDNNFHTIPNDPTTKYHNTIHKALQQCDRIIDKKQIKYLVQKNPTPPTLNALLKLHKPNIPIRPVVNNRNAPSYKIAKKLNGILNHSLQLDNQYTATNSNTLANALANLKITPRQYNYLFVQFYMARDFNRRYIMFMWLAYTGCLLGAKQSCEFVNHIIQTYFITLIYL